MPRHIPSAASRLVPMLVTLFVAMTYASHASEPAPPVEQRQFEARFLTEMIDHHTMAVMTSEMCLERAVHPDLVELCHVIREAQLEEITTMQTWLEEWYGIYHEPAMTPGMQNDMEKLAGLSGAEFEREFMTMMIRHHWMAVVNVSHCRDRAHHPELIGLCEQIEQAQLAEIEQMGAWLCDWYELCNYHGSST